MKQYLRVGHVIAEIESRNISINDLFDVFKKCDTYEKFNIECDLNNIECKIAENDFYEIKEEIDFHKLASYEMKIT